MEIRAEVPLQFCALMVQLVADRFFLAGSQWTDAGTGLRVSLRICPAGSRGEQMAWSLNCETLANLRHDAINPLIDFGMVDGEHRFEAYVQRGALRSASTRGIEHGVEFLRASGVVLEPESARLALRPLVPGPVARGRPLGVTLQPRRAFEAIVDALDGARPAGIARMAVVGPRHSGLRTLRVLAARAARLHGYVPVAGAVLAGDRVLCASLLDRHVCVLVEGSPPGEAVASFVASLASASGRRHLVAQFTRHEAAREVRIDRMGVAAMTAMVFVHEELGPAAADVLAAARDAEGRPGLMVEALAGSPDPAPPAMAMVARETAPVYGNDPARPAGAASRVGQVLLRAGGRAASLARAGRHAAAERLLARAIRVLSARGALDAAGLCYTQLGRLRLDRGLPEAALDAFSEGRDMGLPVPPGIDAAIGTGEARLLQARFAEAEAAFRGALVAARDAQEASLQARAAAGLADCLLRQARVDEAEVALTETGDSRDATALAAVEAARSRMHLHRGEIPAAAASARRAQAHAQESADPHAIAEACEASARVAAAAGDTEAALRAFDDGVRTAREAHLSLAAVRLCVARIELLPGAPRAVPRRGVLPPLLRNDLDAARRRNHIEPSHDERQSELEAMLLIAQGAEDDRRAVARVCDAVLDRVGARTVMVTGRPPESRHLAVSGKPWSGDFSSAQRVLAGETRVAADPAVEPCQAAEPVRYVGELVAAIACRFAPGSPVNPKRTGDVLRAAALAIAPAVRGLLDRALPAAAPAVTGDLHGESAAARALREAILHAARAPFPVLIEGESGSGKELVARAIHRLGARRDRRFCAVNCAALSDDLLEAELFGHARGAFTGAVGERAGLFEDADGGTLFLDEVGELSPRAQAKLLRVLQDGEVRRVGENVPRRVDVRIVAATNRRLEAETAAGRFRADLRFRLDVIRLEVPPLRERAEDVPLLAARFWTEAASRVGTQATLPPETLSALARYDWPGNVRELQNVVAWMAVHSPRRGRVGPSALPAHVARAAVPAATTFEAAREEFERRFVRAALATANGRRGRAAEALGVTRQGLAKMLRRLHIDPP